MKNYADGADEMVSDPRGQHNGDKELSGFGKLGSPTYLESPLPLVPDDNCRRVKQKGNNEPLAAASRFKVLSRFLLSCGLILPLLWVMQESRHFYSTSPAKITLLESCAKSNTTTKACISDIRVHRSSSTESPAFEPYIRYPKVIGHVHMAKTAGTEINGELAAHFERVCGHKGYSYDSWNFNERVKEAQQTLGCTNKTCIGEDTVSQLHPGTGISRGVVPTNVMDEIGYDDCDFISLERVATKWDEIAKMFPMELHVPCRDPLEHLMSQCNHRHIQFQCNVKNVRYLERQVKQCMVGENRFGVNLIHNKNIELKCFNPIPIDPYVDIVGQKLQRKRKEASYIHRPTNTVRDKDEECIWSNATAAKMVEKILHERVYYRWCRQCIGSRHDLLNIGKS